MKVSDLMKILAEYEPDTEVVIDKNGEGSPLSSVSDGRYQPETTWRGELTACPEDFADFGGEHVVVLFPTH